MMDAISGHAHAERVRASADVAVAFGNSCVRMLVRRVGCGDESIHVFPWPVPGGDAHGWAADVVCGDAAAGGYNPRGLARGVCQRLDELGVSARSLHLVVSGRVAHGDGAVELSFLLGPAFTGVAWPNDFRDAAVRARPGGITLLNDTACSGLQAYLALSEEVAAGACAPARLFPALVVDCGTGTSFAYVHPAPASRISVTCLEPWVGSPCTLDDGATLPWWQAVSDAALKEVGAGAWSVRMAAVVDHVLGRLVAARAGPHAPWCRLAAAPGGPAACPVRAVFFTGGNASELDARLMAAAMAPYGVQVRGLGGMRGDGRLHHLRAALAAGAVGHLLDVRNVGEAPPAAVGGGGLAMR